MAGGEIMVAKNDFERAIEKAVGESVDAIRTTPIDERRKKIENKYHNPMQFKSLFPVIGRAGNVLRNYIFTHKEIQAMLDKALLK